MVFLRQYQFSPVVILALAEFAAFFVSPILASLLFTDDGAWHYGVIALLRATNYALVMSLAMMAMGLYDRGQRATLQGILLRVAAGLAGGSAVVGLESYLLPVLQIARGVLGAAVLVSIALTAISRIAFERFADDNIFRRRVMVIGAGKRARSIAQLRRRSDLRAFHIVGFLAVDGDGPVVPNDRLLTVDSSLADYCRRSAVDEIVVAMDDRRRSFPVHDLLECRVRGVEVTDLVDFLERETGKLRLDVLNPSWIIFSPGFSRGAWRRMSERWFDLAVSAVVLALASPVMLLTAIAIKLEDGLAAPVLYRQLRVGLEGRNFFVLKFRSMRVDAERDGAQWAAKQDPRVTRVGSLIRKIRVDELPQLLNVLKGEMSFVGPRPERPEFVALFEDKIPYYRERHYVKPGITGWAQLCHSYGASEADALLKLEYDLYYVKNRSLLFDVMILLRTIEVVLWGKGGR